MTGRKVFGLQIALAGASFVGTYALTQWLFLLLLGGVERFGCVTELPVLLLWHLWAVCGETLAVGRPLEWLISTIPYATVWVVACSVFLLPVAVAEALVRTGGSRWFGSVVACGFIVFAGFEVGGIICNAKGGFLFESSWLVIISVLALAGLLLGRRVSALTRVGLISRVRGR